MEYSDGHSYCHKCKKYDPGASGGKAGGGQGLTGSPWGVSGGSRKPLILDGEIRAIPSRGILLETCRRWGVSIARDEKGRFVMLSTYKDASGQIVGQHERHQDKGLGFPWRGDRPKDVLYGQWLWGKGGKKVVVCEGELDALSVSQANDLKWPVVSLSAGAHSAAKDLNHPAIMRWLDSFEQIVLYFDDDEPGQKAATECAGLFPPGKVFIASVPGYKDANEALQAGPKGADYIRQAIWNAKPYAPVEICTLREVFSGPYEQTPPGLSFPWPEITRITGGMRPNELTVIGAGIGVGKTTLTLELLAHALKEHNQKVGVFPLEQNNKEFGHRLGSVLAGQKLWPDPTEEMYQAAQEAVEPYKDQIQVFQKDHASSWDRMRYILRYMAASGCRLIIIDNLTGVIAGEETGDRVGLIDRIFKELGTLVENFPVHIVVVSHLKRPRDDALQHERGREIDMSDFRGAGSIGIFAHYCWGLERDKHNEEPAKLVLLKDRPNGKVGRVGKVSLHFDELHQRLYTHGSKAAMLGEQPRDGTIEGAVVDIRKHSPDWQISAEGEAAQLPAATDNREDQDMVDFSKHMKKTNGHRYVFDIETNGVDFTHHNPTGQIHTIHCIVARNVNTGKVFRVNSNDMDKMGRGIRHLMEADELIGQNILDFDIPAIQNLYPWFKPLGKLTDTKIMSQVMFPDIKPVDEQRWPILIRQGLAGRHSLEAWGERLGEPKDAYVKWCEENGIEDPWGQWSERQEDYCEQDTTTTYAMYLFLISESNTAPGWDRETFDKIVQLEQDVFEVIRRQRVHGIGFDHDKAKDLYLDLQKATDLIVTDLRGKYVAQLIMPDGRKEKTYKKDMVAKHPTIPGCKIIRRAGAVFCPVKTVDFNPGSSDHISALLINEYGWEPTEGTLTDKSKDLYKQLAMKPEDVPQAVREKKLSVSGAEEVLKALPYPFIDDVLHYQKQTKVCSMVGGGEKSWLACEVDGRIHGKVNTLGAATARMTHNDPNVAQTPAVSVNQEDHPVEGLEGGFGFECRSCFQAGDGKVLIGCDAAGLELRMLGHYMALYDGGAYAEAVIKGDKDAGTDVHSLAMKAMDYNGRNDTKTGEYAFLYGGGDEKLGAITFKQYTDEQAKAFGPPTPAKLKALGADIRARLIGGFPGLEDLVAALAKAFERGWLRGLDGRVLRPRKEHSILNLLLQSAGAIVMKHALVLADRRLREIGLQPGRDYEFVANIHDEWQIETTPELSERIAKIAAIAIEKVERRLKMRVPLAGDSKIGSTWAETH